MAMKGVARQGVGHVYVEKMTQDGFENQSNLGQSSHGGKLPDLAPSQQKF
jgi:hypothetical protein